MRKNDSPLLTSDANIHAVVKTYFSTISIQDLFTIQKEQMDNRNASRFMGKRAHSKLLRAQAKRKAAGKTPYHPENIRL